MSKNQSISAPATHQRRQLGLGKKLLFATAVCLAFFAIVELTLWACGVTTLIEQEDPFRGFSGLVTVFEADGDTYRTRRSSLGTFNDQSFLAEKPADGLRIFCLGGSSAHGFPWGAETAFTGIVGEALAAGHPQRRVEAVNAGGVSYAMHRLNIVADELLAYQPDVFIIYSGHNEFVEPAFFEALKRRNAAHTRLEYLFAHSRFYATARTTFDHITAEAPATGHDFDAAVRRDRTLVFSATGKETIVAEYRWRLERLVRRAQAAGVKVVLVTVPANLCQWRPEASTGLAILSDADRRNWSEAFRSGKRQLHAGQFAAATASLQRAARLAPGHAETQFLLAGAYVGLAQWDDARTAYRRACDADASPIRRVSGINEAIRQVAGQEATLLVDADQIFQQRSEHGLVGFNIIEDYVHPTREGHEIIAWHIWEAIEQAGWFGRKTPAKRAIFDNLIAQRRRRPVTNSTSATWLCNQAVVLGNQGNVDAAIEKYRQALAVSPGHEVAMLDLGPLLNQTGNYTDAVDLLHRLIRKVPDNAKAHVSLGHSLQSLGRPQEAITHYKYALRIKPDDAGAHNSLGNALQVMGRTEEAVAHLQQAVRLRPNFVAPQVNMGVALQKLGRVEQAVTHYQIALRTTPDDAEVHNDLGLALVKLGRVEEAISHYQEALQIKPALAEVHFNLSNALFGLGRVEDSVTHYKEALRIKPDYAQAHNNLGNVLQSLGRFDESVAHYQEALRITPDDADAHNNLGTVLAQKGQLADAIKHFEHAVRLKPDHNNARNNLRRAQALLQQQNGSAQP